MTVALGAPTGLLDYLRRLWRLLVRTLRRLSLDLATPLIVLLRRAV